ncbi:MAG: hypothetical protein ABI999_16285 [Acidobacteriota bacterium]
MLPQPNENIEADRLRLFSLIDVSFSKVQPPDGWEKLLRIEDFEEKFGPDFVRKLGRIIFHLEPKETKYALPFSMKYFSAESRDIDYLNDLDWLLMNLNPSSQSEFGLSDFYDSMYRQYSNEEKKAVCEWLRFLKSLHEDYLTIDWDSIFLYWCAVGLRYRALDS